MSSIKKKQNVTEISTGTHIFGMTFLALIAVLFIAGAVLMSPWQKAISLSETGLGEVQSGTKYYLNASEYRVVSETDQQKVAERFIPKVHQLAFFEIEVHPENINSFVMQVRVEEEAEALRHNTPVRLEGYFPASELNNDTGKELCLYTDIDGKGVQTSKFIILLLMSAICIGLLFILIRHQFRKNRKTKSAVQKK